MNAGEISRRDVIRGASILAAGAAASPVLAQGEGGDLRRIVKKGRINQSASRWCYRKIPLEELCEAGAKMGLVGHYHTGGNPGRNEIDETQELYYPAIMHAIVETGFKGYVAHEFVPRRDPLTSLAQAIEICDV